MSGKTVDQLEQRGCRPLPFSLEAASGAAERSPAGAECGAAPPAGHRRLRLPGAHSELGAALRAEALSMPGQAAVSWAPGAAGSNSSAVPCPVDAGFAQRFLPAVYLAVSLAGLLGNGLGLCNLCAKARRRSWSPLGLLLCNLGVADLLYVVTLPFLVAYYLQRRTWLFGRGMCRLTRGLFHLNLYASIGFLTCISIQRYRGIVYPLKVRGRGQTLGSSLFLCAVVWGWVILQVSPDFAFSKMDPNGTRCHDTTGNENLGRYQLYILAITMTGFVIPFLIILGCYCHVVVVLCRNGNIDPSIKRKCIKLAVLVMVLFSVCFLPYHIFRNLNLLYRTWQHQGFCSPSSASVYVSYQVTRGLASLNSALNPLLYIMTSEDCVSWMRSLSQRASQSLGSLLQKGTQHQPDEKKVNIIFSEQSEETSAAL
ncbi:P2Y purinoceptor 1 [Alligator mississippiensis]|uniref:P2Y purinoceptor 1 n=1 Tax=Alligator mississippiensis TaxID=8496 RepID=UPI0028779651|nr:P2Y purinoceptor 1 [Alligator mississippiensis]